MARACRDLTSLYLRVLGVVKRRQEKRSEKGSQGLWQSLPVVLSCPVMRLLFPRDQCWSIKQQMCTNKPTNKQMFVCLFVCLFVWDNYGVQIGTERGSGHKGVYKCTFVYQI